MLHRYGMMSFYWNVTNLAGLRQPPFIEDGDETSRDLPHGLERRRPHPVEPHAAEGNALGGLFERLHDELEGDAWLIGRVTGREFAKRESYPAHAGQAYPREHWFARRDAAAWGIALDGTARSPGAAPTSAATRSSWC